MIVSHKANAGIQTFARKKILRISKTGSTEHASFFKNSLFSFLSI